MLACDREIRFRFPTQLIKHLHSVFWSLFRGPKGRATAVDYIDFSMGGEHKRFLKAQLLNTHSIANLANICSRFKSNKPKKIIAIKIEEHTLDFHRQES